MSKIQIAEPGTDAAGTVFTLLGEAAATLQRQGRDAAALQLANRIRGFLARFPTHFSTEWLERKPDGEVVLNRVALSDWPDWSDSLARYLHSSPTKPEKPLPRAGADGEAIRFAEITNVPADTLDRLQMGIANDSDQMLAYNALAAYAARGDSHD